MVNLCSKRRSTTDSFSGATSATDGLLPTTLAPTPGRTGPPRICNYWHDAPAPLPHEQPTMLIPSLPPSDNELPNLSKHRVEFEEHSTFDNVEWWTAAYVHWPLKTVTYVQKVLTSSGLIGENGVVWFPTKEDALYSLRYTVTLRKQSPGTTRRFPQTRATPPN